MIALQPGQYISPAVGKRAAPAIASSRILCNGFGAATGESRLGGAAAGFFAACGLAPAAACGLAACPCVFAPALAGAALAGADFFAGTSGSAAAGIRIGVPHPWHFTFLPANSGLT